ncbi:response regulator transcription factor [Desulfosporosinus sp. PR]|uniref:response regulator transcription factor n=1 Tax=Candidatus Desulfosporosinus nitrosoreducens TaxID=3401928 RepID=UPI0027EB4A1C|nr:response regulator transcription factor [Desulfosporosinus sp. PR]MDQ7094650.1 response regulator transcription factor [Desulfosporosinus sp. PR]
MINVILTDDQEIVREGLKMMLSLDEEIRIIGEASNGRELLLLLEKQLPDVILMDIRMPGLDGVETTEIIKREHPEIRVIILTTFNEDEYIFRGLKNGADGYILKDSGSDDIIKAIKTAYSGNILLNPEVAAKVVKALNTTDYNSKSDNEATNLTLLTPRELEVARLVAEGKNNREIGNSLFLTEGTVKNYVTRILEKLELNSRTELALYIHDTH